MKEQRLTDFPAEIPRQKRHNPQRADTPQLRRRYKITWPFQSILLRLLMPCLKIELAMLFSYNGLRQSPRVKEVELMFFEKV